MENRIKASIMLRFYIESTDMIRRVRRSIKGLQTCSLKAIQLLGEHPEGIRVCELTNDRHSQILLYSIFRRERKHGNVDKTGSTYYLTDKGRQAYNALYEETKVMRQNIIDTITKEVQHRLKNTQ